MATLMLDLASLTVPHFQAPAHWCRLYEGAGKQPRHGLDYLQAVRLTGLRVELLKQLYETLSPSAEEMVVAATAQVDFDYVLCAPSRHPFSQRYATAVATSRERPDLSFAVSNPWPASDRRLATKGASSEDLLQQWTVNDFPKLRDGATVLLVDDILSTGKTATALVALCNAYGKELKYVLAAALYIPQR